MREAMNADELMRFLSTQGVTLWTEGDRLRYRSPRGALTPELLASLAREKASIMTLLERGPRTGEEPPSVGQQALWFLQQSAPDNVAYNVPFAAKIRSSFDASAFERALRRLVERHRSLRTTFVMRDGTPLRRVADSWRGSLERVNAAGATPDALLARVRERRDRPFDLAEGPLFRAHLFELGGGEHVFLLVIHHIVVDFWSLTVLLDELGALYAAEASGAAGVLPPVPAEYDDFVAAQADYLAGGDGERDLEFWRETLRGELPALDFPADRSRPPAQSFRGAQCSFTLGADETRALRELAQGEGRTLNTLLTAAFQILLARCTGHEDLLVGTLTAGRNDRRFFDTVGYFVNPVPLRVRYAGELTFARFLERTQAALLAAIDHQDYPFPRLVERLQPERDPSRSPLFQAMFVLQRPPRVPGSLPFAMGQPGATMRLGGLELESIALEQGVSRFDLDLMMTEIDGELVGYLQYNTDLFEHASSGRLATHFKTLLAGIVAQPETPIARLPLLTPDEASRFAAAWNDTAAPIFPGGVHELLAVELERNPAAIAVRCGGESLSHRELHRRANHLAHELQAAGAGRGTLIGVALERSADLVIALIAVLKCGAAYVPLDPTHPRDRLESILEDAGVAVLITQRSLVSILPKHDARVLEVDRVELERSDRDLEPSPVTVAGSDLAYVIYTSGSTGRPKGVEVTHRGVVNFLASIGKRIGLTREDVLVAVTTPSFDIAVLELFLPLTLGAVVVIASRDETMDGRALALRMEREGCTVMQATPATWNMLLDSGWNGHARFKALCGGEALSRELADRLLARSDSLWNLYGPTETTVWSSAWQVQRGGRAIELGTPLDNTELYVLDALRQPVPSNVLGELCIGGAGLARGYHGMPELTRERFVSNPFGTPDSRLYRTGDLVRRRSNGALEFVGRRDHQIKIRGYRVELGEIDAVLAKHPAVRQAATVLKRTRDDARLVTYVVGDGAQLPAPEREAFQSERIRQWQSVWNETYGRSKRGRPTRFDITGWNDSYSGEPVGEEAMSEWVDGAVRDVLAAKPKSVLEVGCGTGLVLFRVAPRCERYVGVDFSSDALDLIRSQLDEEEARKVVLHRLGADEIAALEPERFDVVIFNSVVQYFPGTDYLLRALGAALRLTRPGGLVYVGDVRSRELLENFHTSVEFARAPGAQTSEGLRARVRQRVAEEEELALSPGFFHALPGAFPELAEVRISPRSGRHWNEMTRFRCRAFLRTRAPAGAPPAPPEVLRDPCRSLDDLRSAVENAAGGEFALRNVQNARLTRDNRLLELLRCAPSGRTVYELRAALDASVQDGLDPDAVVRLGEEYGYRVEIGWDVLDSAGGFDARFLRDAERTAPSDAAAPEPASALATSPEAFRRLANDPLGARYRRLLATELRATLRTQLPEYMVPSSVVLLDAMPLGPSGKIDRLALERSEEVAVERGAPYEAPRSELEQRIATIWQEVLRVETIGLDDNFFDLGGHSLLVIQMRERIRASWGIDLPVTVFFQFPSIRALAKHLGGDRHDGVEEAKGRAALRKSLGGRSRPVRRHPFEKGS